MENLKGQRIIYRFETNKKALVCTCIAQSPAHAIKITNEKRAQFLASGMFE